MRAILKVDPESRNSDRRLVLEYLRRYYGVKLPPEAENALLSLPIKSIINERQHIQNVERKYLPPDPKVRRIRDLMRKAVQAAHRRRGA